MRLNPLRLIENNINKNPPCSFSERSTVSSTSFSLDNIDNDFQKKKAHQLPYYNNNSSNVSSKLWLVLFRKEKNLVIDS